MKKEKPLLALEDKKPDSEEEAVEEDTPLKKADEVSLDSSRFPAMFGTPEKASKDKGNPAAPSFLRRRLGSQAAASSCQAKKTDLQKSLGYTGSSTSLAKGKGLKKPAAAKSKNKKKGTIKKGTLKKEPSKEPSLKKDNNTVSWARLRKTVAKKPARAYICGAHDPKHKIHLVIEVSEKMAPNFENIIERIYLALKKDDLTNQEARDMRAALLGWN